MKRIFAIINLIQECQNLWNCTHTHTHTHRCFKGLKLNKKDIKTHVFYSIFAKLQKL